MGTEVVLNSTGEFLFCHPDQVPPEIIDKNIAFPRLIQNDSAFAPIFTDMGKRISEFQCGPFRRFDLLRLCRVTADESALIRIGI